MSVEQVQRIGFPESTYRSIVETLGSAHPEPFRGYASVAPNQFYSMHFWMYSLLAVPFYALLHVFGLTGLYALGLLNLSFAAAVFWYMRRTMPQHTYTAFALFLAMGTTFYLSWTGPEVMGASCALIASIALLRGEAGFATLIAGLGSTQNPSLIFMMPAAWVFRLMLHKWPQLSWPGTTAHAVDKREIFMASTGVMLAALPYVFFQAIFGIPSLTGHYATDPSLISFDRLISFFFDLDQGMLIGLPGLFAALAISPFLIAPQYRRRWLLMLLISIAAVLMLTVPALAAGNWNSGCIVMLRYAYWAAMPLLTVILLSLQFMIPRRRAYVVVTMFVLQGVVFAGFGVKGDKHGYLEHSRLALWVLKHHPGWYNPAPEIFYERSISDERALTHDLTYMYQVNGVPLKLLRHESNHGPTAGLCPGDQRMVGQDIRKVDGGWRYLHAPFQCRTVGDSKHGGFWRINSYHPDSRNLIPSGWSYLEDDGVWGVGLESRLILPIPPVRAALRLNTRGHYYTYQDKTIVIVNGRTLGAYNLSDANILIPAALLVGKNLDIVFKYEKAISPKSRGESTDDRKLGFYLNTVLMESADD